MLLAIIAGIIIGTGVAFASLGPRLFLLIAITLSTVGPLFYRVMTRKFNVFEPIVIANLSFFIMFVVRPVAILVAGQMVHLGYDITQYVDQTLGIVVVGVLVFQVAYASPAGPQLARSLPAPSSELSRTSAEVYAAGMFLVGMALYLVFLDTSGGIKNTLESFLAGRSPSQNALFIKSTGYLYNGINLAIPASLVFIALGIYSRRAAYFIVGTTLGMIVAVVATGTGARSTLLPLAAAPITLWYIAHDRRPKLREVFALTLIMLVGISFFRETRTAGSIQNRNKLQALLSLTTRPKEQLEQLILGPDTEMFDSLANEAEIVPEIVPYRPGSTLLDIAIRAIPRPLWPDKPLESNDLMVSTLWPTHYSQSRASAAFSLLGQFYADYGLIGVAVGMTLVGLAMRMLWEYFLLSRRNPYVQLDYSILLPFIPILLRGTVQDTLARALFIAAPLLALPFIASVRSNTKQQTDNARCGSAATHMSCP